MIVLLAACTPETTVCIGLDADQDGVCDREVADFSEGAAVPPGGRANLFELEPEELALATERGFEAALSYPVDVTGILMPYRPLEHFFDPANNDAAVLRSALAASVGYDSMETLYDGVGLVPFDDVPGTEPWAQPIPEGLVDARRMGVSVVPTALGEGLSFSCAACHAGRFLGRSVRGLTNRRPRANTFFELGQNVLPNIPPDVFQQVTGADDDELEMLAASTRSVRRIGLKTPERLGLDTSLAQVALSLARRGDGPDAPQDSTRENTPLPNPLATEVADSKPMPWWTLKYKNRWLADGSIVQGNPVLTNFLWNELGRGVDLPELGDWLEREAGVVDDLTVAVFNAAAPRWTDFFPADSIDLDAAKRGQVLFEATCAGCHGTYHKGWDTDAADPLATVEVEYDASLGSVDVGTDPGRAAGIAHLGPRLNELAISASMQTVVQVQQGYVPPPLDGVFARYPYLHNNSVPTLCDLLLPAELRTSAFVQGPSELPEDFDAVCVGYPVGDAIPARWERTGAEVDAVGVGLSNAGHDSWLRAPNGDPRFSAQERADLVMFLKTL